MLLIRERAKNQLTTDVVTWRWLATKTATDTNNNHQQSGSWHDPFKHAILSSMQMYCHPSHHLIHLIMDAPSSTTRLHVDVAGQQHPGQWQPDCWSAITRLRSLAIIPGKRPRVPGTTNLFMMITNSLVALTHSTLTWWLLVSNIFDGPWIAARQIDCWPAICRQKSFFHPFFTFNAVQSVFLLFFLPSSFVLFSGFSCQVVKELLPSNFPKRHEVAAQQLKRRN